MQTFLPYSDFLQSTRILDMKRLGKQRVETLQILTALLNNNQSRWFNHPATQMWREYELALVKYGLAICDEWLSRGYRDTCRDKILGLDIWTMNHDEVLMPWWLGVPEFHRSHQSNLLRKKPEHYSKYFRDVPDDLPYLWPAPQSEPFSGSFNFHKFFTIIDGKRQEIIL